MFSGRADELRRLTAMLAAVRSGGEARFVLLRGRRQVGKSRLVEEFLRTVDVPSVFFTATKARVAEVEIRDFVATFRAAGLDPSDSLVGASYATWDSALAACGRLIETPTVVVIDELPYLLAGAADAEGSFQKAWDRNLKGRPLLLVVIGSDLAVMTALTQYDRPLYGRPTDEMHVKPLDPAETAELAGLDGVAAFEAYLATGGFPNVVGTWPRGASLKSYLERRLTSSSERIVVTGERMLTAEFAPDSHARLLLSAIGTGTPTFAALGSQTGLGAASLNRALELLVAKSVITVDRPLSAQAPTETRYRVVDTYLSFWLRFIEPALPLLERGRSDLVVAAILQQWPDYRGRAIEPIVREAVARLLPFGDVDAHTVGAYWNRGGSTEVDVVGVSGSTKRPVVSFAGSIKWRERRPFSGRDAQELAAAAAKVPGATSDTQLIAVSASGFDVRDIAIRLGPDDLLGAWSRPESSLEENRS